MMSTVSHASMETLTNTFRTNAVALKTAEVAQSGKSLGIPS